ncbi:3-dehydroquinate synthase [Clostridium intestinale]|uniref:3-dehydroquinate synthase n=1 Tax=Clostridium intestinale TaxID=36845 RepID=UPI0028EDBA68|nr:3-dehydroquinate synthase [Clostridium intestinale]WRY51667.1 3-dehydroquinate synthase [Clostridium intestinale]
MELKVNLEENSYPIIIEKGSIKNISKHLKDKFKGKKIAIISDNIVYGIYGDLIKEELEAEGYTAKAIVIPAGEKSKSFSTLPAVYNELLEFKLTRTDIILALGGGVVGDLAGFVASTYLRGVPFIQIPTTLLAQVDSSVGGKVGVDLEKGKNLVGGFYHPKIVIIDPEVLNTLSDRIFKDGLAEVIKYGCIKDKDLFDKLKAYKDKKALIEDIEEIVYTCCDIKRKVVEEDEKDTGERMLLNFGHTLGHAIEQYYKYERYTHGEGVAIGMYQIMKSAYSKGLVAEGVAEEIKDILIKYDLPYSLDGENIDELINVIKLDKKNINNSLSLILLKEIGESYIYLSNENFFSDI